VADPDPSLRLVVGADAEAWIADKMRQEESDLARWTPSTD
jgi:hypothetical protein